MITKTSTLQAAIVSAVRSPVTVLQLWLDGDTGAPYDFSPVLAGLSIDRTPQDTPDQVSRLAGSIAASATIQLDRKGPSIPGGDGISLSADFAPYMGTLVKFRDRDYGIGMRVAIRQGFMTTVGAETLQTFIGRIDSVDVGDSGAVTLHALDGIADLQAKVNVPVAAVADTSAQMPIYMAVEHLLRGGGYYRTPPPLKDCVLSVPCLLPEIGDVATPLTVGAVTAGNNCRYAAWGTNTSVPTGNKYIMTSNYAPRPGQFVVIEGWWKAASAAEIFMLVTLADDSANPGGLRVQVDSTRAVYVQAAAGSGVNLRTPAAAWPSDGGWHYLLVRLQPSGGASSCFVRVDATDYTTTWSATSNRDDLQPPDNGSRIVTIGGLPHEGVSVRFAPSIGYVQTPRNSWTPNYQTSLLGTSPTVKAIPRGQTGKLMDVIREIATATGATFRWTEDGTWRWKERASAVAQRITAPVDDYDHTRALIGSGYAYGSGSRLGAVTIDWSEFALQRSTVAAPAWAATEVIIVKAGRTDVILTDTDRPILGLAPVFRTSVASATYSSVQVVPAYQVGDPAAQLMPGLTISIAPTATGFRTIIRNPTSTDAALWDPVSGQPAFSIQGYTLTGGDVPRLYTANASARSMETLELPQSPWRQNRADAVAMADAIASDTALPAVVFGQQQALYDPALTVDDVIRIRAPEVMSGLVACQVIGLANTDGETATMTVRACYAPTGWILGLAGRSELGSTTPLVV